MMFRKIIPALLMFFAFQNVFAQDIDKNLYQKTTISEINWDTKGTEHYKFDVVFVDRGPHENAGAGNDHFYFFKLNGDDKFDDEYSIFPGPNTLPLVSPGQLVTVYLRLFPSTKSNETTLDVIDHIEIPAEDFSFTATHKTIEKTNILFPLNKGILLTLDSCVEVQVLGINSYVSEIEGEKGRLMWLVTGDGYGGWVFSPSLEPLPHIAALENSSEDYSFTATHRIIMETNIWSSPGEDTPIASGVEVQVLGASPFISKGGDGKGGWLTGHWWYMATSEGYRGWVFSSHLTPLPQTTAVEAAAGTEAASIPSTVVGELKTQAPAVVNEPEPAIVPEAEQSGGFPLLWVIAGLCAVLLVVIIAIIVVKRKKK